MQKQYNNLEKRIKNIERRCCCSSGSIDGGCCYNEVTYAEAQALVAANELIKGSLYKITDRGDLGIYLEAVENNKFEEEGVRNMLIPNVNLIHEFRYWDYPDVSYDTGDNTVYEGLVYESLVDGNIETPVDDGINWQLIPKALDNDEYVNKTFGVLYDFEEDWIYLQWDEYDNRVGHAPDQYGGENRIEITDWWLFQFVNNQSVDSYNFVYNNRAHGIYGNTLIHDGGQGRLHDNTCLFGTISGNSFTMGGTSYGIYLNNVAYGINNNIGITGIYGNTCFNIASNVGQCLINNNTGGVYFIVGNVVGAIGSIDISYNTTLGDISGNVTEDGEGNYSFTISYNSNIGGIVNNIHSIADTPIIISNNMNNGSIDANTDFTTITLNKNNGAISSNSCTTITQNSNNGTITTNSGAFDIFNNINNGTIGPNVMVADISDAIVNK